jgi:hypothetical protein
VRRANYGVTRDVPGEPLEIRDLGPWDRHPTVTNVAEDVVAELFRNGRLTSGRRLFYEDSEGRRDEILIENGRFAGFAPG